MTVKQEMVIGELLKGSSITDACKSAHISRKTYYSWLSDKVFTDELKARKQAILNDCVAYLRSKFKTASKELVMIIESPDTPSQIKINAIDSMMRSYRVIAEEDCISRLDELESQLKRLSEERDDADENNE